MEEVMKVEHLLKSYGEVLPMGVAYHDSKISRDFTGKMLYDMRNR